MLGRARQTNEQVVLLSGKETKRIAFFRLKQEVPGTKGERELYMLQEQSLEGLSEREAVAQRVRGHGNDITQRTGRTYWQIVREAVFPLVNTILYVLCVALLLLGQISEGLISFGVVLLNVLISVT